MHHGATGEVQHAPVPHQGAVAAPDHVRDRRIDQGEPHRGEDQHGGELHALGEGTDDQRRGDDGEGHLEGDEDAFREGRGQAIHRQAIEEGLVQTTDEGAEVGYTFFHAGRIEGQAVTVNDPQDADQRGDGEALHHHRQHVLGAHHAAVEQRQAGNGHQQHERRRDQHPGGVTAIEYGFLGSQGQAWHYEGQKGS
ncbi:hypothetical protein D3C76_1056570 [compost metagenome]